MGFQILIKTRASFTKVELLERKPVIVTDGSKEEIKEENEESGEEDQNEFLTAEKVRLEGLLRAQQKNRPDLRNLPGLFRN